MGFEGNGYFSSGNKVLGCLSSKKKATKKMANKKMPQIAVRELISHSIDISILERDLDGCPANIMEI